METPSRFEYCLNSRLTPCSISISLVYLVASRTSWLSQDPMLWFTMMLMPTGPPALKLTAIAEVIGSSEDEKMAISKFLSVSFFLSRIFERTDYVTNWYNKTDCVRCQSLDVFRSGWQFESLSGYHDAMRNHEVVLSGLEILVYLFFLIISYSIYTILPFTIPVFICPFNLPNPLRKAQYHPVSSKNKPA